MDQLTEQSALAVPSYVFGFAWKELIPKTREVIAGWTYVPSFGIEGYGGERKPIKGTIDTDPSSIKFQDIGWTPPQEACGVNAYCLCQRKSITTFEYNDVSGSLPFKTIFLRRERFSHVISTIKQPKYHRWMIHLQYESWWLGFCSECFSVLYSGPIKKDCVEYRYDVELNSNETETSTPHGNPKADCSESLPSSNQPL